MDYLPLLFLYRKYKYIYSKYGLKRQKRVNPLVFSPLGIGKVWNTMSWL